MTLEHVGPAVVEELLDTMVSGFLDDPLYVWLHPDPTTRPERLRPSFELVLRSGLDRGVVRWTEDRDAVAIWTQPGVALLEQADMDRWLEQLRIDVGDRFEAAVEGMAACGELEPGEPHWTLHSVVVAGGRQGRGLGSALLRETLAEVDAAGEPVYLESSNLRNVPAYERLGFEVLGEVELRGGPVMRPMWRHASVGG